MHLQIFQFSRPLQLPALAPAHAEFHGNVRIFFLHQLSDKAHSAEIPSPFYNWDMFLLLNRYTACSCPFSPVFSKPFFQLLCLTASFTRSEASGFFLQHRMSYIVGRAILVLLSFSFIPVLHRSVISCNPAVHLSLSAADGTGLVLPNQITMLLTDGIGW